MDKEQQWKHVFSQYMLFTFCFHTTRIYMTRLIFAWPLFLHISARIQSCRCVFTCSLSYRVWWANWPCFSSKMAQRRESHEESAEAIVITLNQRLWIVNLSLTCNWVMLLLYMYRVTWSKKFIKGFGLIGWIGLLFLSACVDLDLSLWASPLSWSLCCKVKWSSSALTLWSAMSRIAPSVNEIRAFCQT